MRRPNPILPSLLAAMCLGGAILAQPAVPDRSRPPAPELATPDMLGRATQVLWEDEFPRELAESAGLAMFRRTIWGTTRSAIGLELLRLDVTDMGTSGSLGRIHLEEIPPGQDPAALVWMPEAASVWLATNPMKGSTERPKLYRAGFGIEAEPGPFKEAKLPDDLARIARMRAIDGQLVILGEGGTEAAPTVRLYVSPWTGAKLADWASNDERPFNRSGYDLAVFRGLAVILGGGPEAGSKEEMANSRLNLAARFGYPNVGEFATAILPLPRPLAHVSAMCAGSHAVATGDLAMMAKGDSQTSLTLFATNDIGEGTSTNWRMVPMNAPIRRGAHLLHNQSDSQLLLVGGRTADGADATTAMAFSCPNFGDQKSFQQLMADEQLNKVRVAKNRLPERGVENVRSAALRDGKYVLTLFPGDGPEGDETLTTLSSSTAFTSMASQAYVNRVAADNDQGVSSKFGVTKFPALVLHTANGRVLAVHEGKVPTMEDVFRVTSPTRDPIGTHPDTTAGPN